MRVFTAGTSPKRPFTGTFMGAYPRPSSRVGTSPPLIPSQCEVTRESSLYNLEAFPIGVPNVMSRFYYVNVGLLIL